MASPFTPKYTSDELASWAGRLNPLSPYQLRDRINKDEEVLFAVDAIIGSALSQAKGPKAEEAERLARKSAEPETVTLKVAVAAEPTDQQVAWAMNVVGPMITDIMVGGTMATLERVLSVEMMAVLIRRVARALQIPQDGAEGLYTVDSGLLKKIASTRELAANPQYGLYALPAPELDPVAARVAKEFNVTHVPALRTLAEWSELISKRVRLIEDADVRPGRPQHEDLRSAVAQHFGPDLYRMRDTLRLYHAEAWQAELAAKS